MTKIIGITGGIGSGKSTLSKELRKLHFKVHDSDEEVHIMYKKPTKDFLKTLNKIGLGGSLNKKNIDKKTISKIIFNNKNIKKNLENYIFKNIRKKRSQFIKSEKRKKTKYIFLDIPLLFENDLDKACDLIVCVLAKREERFKRLSKTKKMSKKLFNKIVLTQCSDKERRKRSDILINNNFSLKEYMFKIHKMINKLFL